MKNKKGMMFLFSLMMGVLFFVLGMAIAPAFKDVSQEAMDSKLLNCSNSSTSDQNKAVCTSLDVMMPLFIGVIFGLSGMLIGRLL